MRQFATRNLDDINRAETGIRKLQRSDINVSFSNPPTLIRVVSSIFESPTFWTASGDKSVRWAPVSIRASVVVKELGAPDGPKRGRPIVIFRRGP